MFTITLRATCVEPAFGEAAAADVEAEFQERAWHETAACTFADGALTLVVTNDFDKDGRATLDEFSDAIAACVPLEGARDDGGIEVVGVVAG